MEPNESRALVGIHAYCLMDNHFHMLIEQKSDGGVSKFMQRTGNSYTKYFNIRHERSGRLFQNAYQVKHIDTDAYFEYLQAYIHTNPRELRTVNTWRDLKSYPWSSLNIYLNNNDSFIARDKINSLYSTMNDLEYYIKHHYQHRMLESFKDGE
jgi:putative transposase